MIDKNASAYAALVLRVAIGISFVAYGFLLKVLTYGPGGTAAYFTSIGYPAALAYLVILAEVGGGLMLLAGLWSRWVSLALLPILLGATLEHAANGWVFSVANGGWSYPAFWAATLVVQALLGDGAFALRPAVERLFAGPSHSQARA
ncbi:MAG TPA: DoxX family protein [Azospirillaceae bacterium]|nr:DoxX family protein [Azospirillaceae bacterium]